MHPSQEAHVGSMEKLLDFWSLQLNIDIGLTGRIEICSAMASIESQVSFAFSKLSRTDSGEDENMVEGCRIEHNTYIT